MEEVTVARMQAVELARVILEARDEELAFELQLQEIVQSYTLTIADGHAAAEVLEETLQQPWDNSSFAECRTAVATHTSTTLTLAVDELESLHEATEEMQLSLAEVARLTQLDAIQEHDARFSRSLANMPLQAWERNGHRVEDPFTISSNANNPILNEVDGFDLVVQLLEDDSNRRSQEMFHSVDGGNVVENSGPLEEYSSKPPVSMLHRKCPPGGTLDSNQKKKGKMVLSEKEDNEFPTFPIFLNSQSTSSSLLWSAAEMIEHEDVSYTETDIDSGEIAQEACQICFEAKATSEFVSIEGCGHQFCKLCAGMHAEARVVSGGQTQVTCPYLGCTNVLSFTQLSSLLNSTLLDILTRRQIEAAIPDAERIYCPFLDCSALLMRPNPDGLQPSTSAHPHPTTFGCVECEICHRAFCLECSVPWHADLSCAEYKGDLKNQRLLGDVKLLELAKSKKWQRCKNCGRFVEHNAGCYHMSCLCGHEFCYVCGDTWKGRAGKSCSCLAFNESRL